MRSKLFGTAVAALAMTLVAPFATAQETTPVADPTPTATESVVASPEPTDEVTAPETVEATEPATESPAPEETTEPEATEPAEDVTEVPVPETVAPEVVEPEVTEPEAEVSEAPAAETTAPAPRMATRSLVAPAAEAPAPRELTPEQAVYRVPGYHYVNGRYWYTDCVKYSSNTVRCESKIYASTVYQHNGRWYTQNAFVFNNLTYLPSGRSVWANNPLGGYGEIGGKAEWTATDGRKWRTECDTAATGRGGCRNYAMATVASLVSGRVVQENKWVLNSIVNFETSLDPWVKTIAAPNPTPGGIPKNSTPKPVNVDLRYQAGMRLDSRCLTGRAFCVSMDQNKMAWVVNGKVQSVVDVRFGLEETPTRLGAFRITWKSRNHVSSIYNVAMPFALFFDGGIAIHYSEHFARVGYAGGSGGCVNVRDWDQMERYFNTARVGDKVIVYN